MHVKKRHRNFDDIEHITRQNLNFHGGFCFEVFGIENRPTCNCCHYLLDMNTFVLQEPSNETRVYKVKWTPQEDQLLTAVVASFGSSRWDFIAKHVPGRNGRQCRERWLSMLSPDVCHSAWTEEEDNMLLRLQSELGNHWSTIAKSLPGRTAIMAKNRFRLLCRHEKASNTTSSQASKQTKQAKQTTQTAESSALTSPFVQNTQQVNKNYSEIKKENFQQQTNFQIQMIPVQNQVQEINTFTVDDLINFQEDSMPADIHDDDSFFQFIDADISVF